MAKSCKLPTQAEMTEILARGMGWTRSHHDPKKHYGCFWWMNGNEYAALNYEWHPFTDRNVIAEIEERLSEEQRKVYVQIILKNSINEWGNTDIFAIRHASPAICAEALAQVFEPGRFE